MLHDDFPIPKKIDFADICRDGGTYVLGYLDCEEHFYELELPVILDHKLGRIGYEAPVLVNYDPGLHGCEKEKKQLSWTDGMQLHAVLLPLLNDGIGCGGRVRAEEMLQLIKLRGELP